MSHFPRSLPSTARRLRLGENPATGMQGGNRSSSPTISHASFHRLCASPVSALPFAVAAPRRPPPPSSNWGETIDWLTILAPLSLTFGLHLRLLHGLRLVIIFRIFTFPVTNTYLKSRMSLYFGMVQTLARWLVVKHRTALALLRRLISGQPNDKTGKMSKQRGLLNNSVVRRACLIRGDRRASQMGRECVHRMGGKY
uniref:Uncharacterized protein n=1 Tax=Oryza meridionalis TaxID=40149 RepID=A0A0E0CKJ8_9ORYZ